LVRWDGKAFYGHAGSGDGSHDGDALPVFGWQLCRSFMVAS
jgi:hypothetical protein